VHNCNENVAATAFISGLQVIHSFYKYLVKNDVTKMRDILIRAQKYMQIEKTTQSATNHPLNKDPRARSRDSSPPEEESKSQLCCCPQDTRHARELNKDGATEPDLIPFRILVDHVFMPSKISLGSNA